MPDTRASSRPPSPAVRAAPSVPDRPPAREALLFDERGHPTFRRLFGELCRSATEVDVALTRIRLSTLDLTDEELRGVRRIRLLLSEVNSVSLDVEAHALLAGGRRGDTLRALRERLAAGRVEIRASPLAGWSPDFTVFADDGRCRAVLLGFHWFQRPFPHRGPAWGCLFGAAEAERAGRRFREAWERAHDIAGAVREILDRAGAEDEGRGG